MTEYYSNWKAEDYSCRHCGWKGKGDECNQGEYFQDLFEMDCPKCHEHIFVVVFPTLKDMRDNWGNLSDIERKQYLLVEKHNENLCFMLKQILNNRSQGRACHCGNHAVKKTK